MAYLVSLVGRTVARMVLETDTAASRAASAVAVATLDPQPIFYCHKGFSVTQMFKFKFEAVQGNQVHNSGSAAKSAPVKFFGRKVISGSRHPS